MENKAELIKALASSEVNFDNGDVKANYLASVDNSGNFSTTDASSNYSTIDYDWYREYWQPNVIKEYVPYYVTTRYVTEEDKFKKAFSIAKLMLKKKLLVSRKLPDFIQLVEMIAQEI